MTITIKRKARMTQIVRVGGATILLFVVVGLLARWLRDEPREGRGHKPPLSLDFAHAPGESQFLTIELAVDASAHEAAWVRALAHRLEGRTEVAVANGRVDVLSDYYAVEVDFLPKWKEGLGQALHYGVETSRTPVLALIATAGVEAMLASKIKSLAKASGVKIVLLAPQR